MKSSKFTGKMEKIKAKWTQVSLKNVLKVKDPNLSRVLIVQNNVYAAVHGAIGGDSLEETCSFLLGNYHTIILTNSYSCSRRLGCLLTLPASLLNFFPLKFAAAGLPKNLRNVQLGNFFRLYFCCLLDQDLKGQCQ